MQILPNLEDIDELFSTVGGFETVYKKLFLLAHKQLLAARKACPTAVHFAELEPLELVHDALRRVAAEVSEGENPYFAARNFIRNGIRTDKKSPKALSLRFPPLGGSNEQWDDFFDSQASDTKTPSEVTIVTERECDYKKLFDVLKLQFAEDADVCEFITAIECGMVERKEIVAETDLDGPRYDAAFKRYQRAAVKEKGLVTDVR